MKPVSLLVLFLMFIVAYGKDFPTPPIKSDIPANYKLKQPITGAFGLTLGEVFGTVDADGKWTPPEGASNIDKSHTGILKQIVCDYQPTKENLFRDSFDHPYSYKVVVDSATYKIVRIDITSEKKEYALGTTREQATKEWKIFLAAMQSELDKVLNEFTKKYGKPAGIVKSNDIKYRTCWQWSWCETDKDGKISSNRINVAFNGQVWITVYGGQQDKQ